jgi:hypothetical protein
MHGLHGQQFRKGEKFDALPDNYSKELSMLENIRCVTYLFVKDFEVKDSAGNIYVSLYYPEDNHQTTPESIEATNSILFQTAYFLAFYPRLAYIQQLYNDMVIESYNKDGKLFHTGRIPISVYRQHESGVFLNAILSSLRLPNTWAIQKKHFEIIYYCIDPSEIKVFYKPLVHVLTKLKLLNKKLNSWAEVYTFCDPRQKDFSVIIKLPK